MSDIALAQIDSIENEIINYQSSKLEIISKARRLLADKLVQGDYQKMKEIKDYLKNKIEEDKYSSFSIHEYWLILFWTQEFDELLGTIELSILKVDGQTLNETNYQIVTEADELYQKLLEKSFESKYFLELVINSSQMGDEEKDFLILHLNYCLLNFDNKSITQDSLNIQSDKFIFKYPTSPYRPFIKREIQYKEKISDFSIGYDFFMGYGTFKGGISNNLVDYVPFGFSIDLNYKDFNINIGTGLGVAKLKQDIIYNNITWEREMRADIYYPYACFGYSFFGKRQLSINPFAGIYSLILLPNYDDIQYYPALEDIFFQSDASVLAGFSINYYGRPSNTSNRNHKMVHFQGFIRLKYTYYQSGFKKEFYGFDGSMHTICLSFGGIMKRVYRI